MSADKSPPSHPAPPNELTPEQAREKRRYHLALAREQARAATERENTADDAGDATVAAFVLPGGD